MIRAAIGLAWSAWGGHAAVIAGSLLALQIHAAYRVPAAAFVALLPWLGVVVTVATILMLTVNLMPTARGRRAGAVRTYTRRSVAGLAAIVIATTVAGALAGMSSPAAALLGLALAAVVASVVGLTGRCSPKAPWRSPPAGSIAPRCWGSRRFSCGPPSCSSTGRSTGRRRARKPPRS